MNENRPNADLPSPLLVAAVRGLTRLLGRTVWRISYEGVENIPPEDGEGLLVVPNHQTYLDPFWIGSAIRRDLRFMAWDEAFGWFAAGWLIRRLGAFPMSLRRGGTVRTLKDTLRHLREGRTLIVFPEGEREFADGKLLKFKTGAARIALESGVPVLPVTVRGGNRIWPRGRRLPRPGRVEIFFHPPVRFEKPSDPHKRPARTNEVSDVLRGIIASKLDRDTD